MGNDHFIIEGILLDEKHSYTLVELAEIGVVEHQLLLEMIDYGIIEPIAKQSENELIFFATAVVRSQKALRLHQDLSIDWTGISLALDLLDEIDALRAQLHKPIR